MKGFRSQRQLPLHAYMSGTWLLSFIFLLSSCSLELVGSVSKKNNSPNEEDVTLPAATLSVTFPDHLSDRIGYVKWFYGDCSEEGKAVEVYQSSNMLGSANCSSGKYSIYADTSTLAVGNHTFSIRHEGPEASLSSIELTLNKWSTACDLLAQRQTNFAGGLAGGTGVQDDPYIICTSDQLQLLSNNNAYFYAMGNDIYFDEGDSNGDRLVNGSDTDYQAGPGWSPIFRTSPNMRDFDGKRFSILGMTINRPTTDDIGFMGRLEIGGLRSLRFYHAQVTGQNHVGVALGYHYFKGFVYDIHVLDSLGQNSLAGNNYAAGIVGRHDNRGCLYSNLSFNGNITGNDYVGGIVGRFNGGIYLSSAKGTFSGNDYVGGIAGAASSGSNLITLSFEGEVGAQSNAGGILGNGGFNVFIENTYASGKINAANDFAGGITANTWHGKIMSSFFSGTVEGSSANQYIGLIIGRDDSPIKAALFNTYYSNDSTATNNGPGLIPNAWGTSAAPAALQDPDSAELANWDFIGSSSDGYSDLWRVGMTPGFPKLYFEEAESNYVVPFAGSGTSVDPYLIDGTVDFEKIASNPRYSDKSLRLTDNVILTDIASFKSLYRFAVFAGEFDGDDFTISGFGYDETDRIGIGLFGNAGAANFKNFTLQLDQDAEAITEASALASFMLSWTKLSRIIIYGQKVHADDGGAGVFCSTCVVVANGLSNRANIEGGYYVGGLFGHTSTSTVTDSYNKGNVTASSGAGGLSGFADYGSTYARVYNTGDVFGTGADLGGFFGHSLFTSISDSFSTGSITGDSTGGGVVGFLFGSTGPITDTNNWTSIDTFCADVNGACAIPANTHPLKDDFTDLNNNPYVNGAWDFGSTWFDNGATNLPTPQ